MKIQNFTLLILICLLTLSSCVINPTDYNMFKKDFTPFSIEISTDSAQSGKYQEITAEALNVLIKKNKITVVFLNTIACGGSVQGTKIRISTYEQIINEAINAASVYVFSGFSIPNIQTVLEGNNILENMYFIHHSYGSNIGIMEHNFFKELGIELKSDKFHREPVYWAVFQNGKLIKKSNLDLDGVELKQLLLNIATQ